MKTYLFPITLVCLLCFASCKQTGDAPLTASKEGLFPYELSKQQSELLNAVNADPCQMLTICVPPTSSPPSLSPPLTLKGLSSTWCFLLEPCKIKAEEEIPVSLRIWNQEYTLPCSLEDFYSPENLKDNDYVQAITLSFTSTPLY